MASSHRSFPHAGSSSRGALPRSQTCTPGLSMAAVSPPSSPCRGPRPSHHTAHATVTPFTGSAGRAEPVTQFPRTVTTGLAHSRFPGMRKCKGACITIALKRLTNTGLSPSLISRVFKEPKPTGSFQWTWILQGSPFLGSQLAKLGGSPAVPALCGVSPFLPLTQLSWL